MASIESGIIAYLYSSANFLDSKHEEKAKKFTHLIKTCNILLRWFPESDPSQIQKQHLCFVDLYNQEWLNNVPDNIKNLAQSCRVILFNVTEGALCEKQALLSGIQGIFYSKDRADIILKGIERINKNERWFKRATMNLAIAELLDSNGPSNIKNAREEDKTLLNLLTRREKTIFNMVSNGAPNKEIADSLNISTNTVKTHIYSIFRKTSSRNRVELMAWSQQFAMKS